MSNHARLRMRVVATGLALAWSAASHATIVTDNNLRVTNLGSTTAAGAQGSTNLAVQANQLVGVSAWVRSTVTSATTVNGYAVQGLSTNPPPVETQLLGNSLINLTGGTPFPTTQLKMLLAPRTGTTNLNYHLGVGAFGGNAFGWQWAATNITSYLPTGADVGLAFNSRTLGNLVPNASFEDSSFNFFSSGTFVSTNVAKQGSQVLQILGTADQHIGVPVTPGKQYFYSFWALSGTGGGGNQIEWGPTVPGDGFAVAAGNSSSSPATTFTEFTGSFVATPTESFFFIGGMSNGTPLYFDSVLVAEIIPEPSSLWLLATGGALLWRSRQRVRARG